MNRTTLVTFFAVAISLGFLIAQPGSSPRLTADTLHDLELRNIPGTFSSGRIADVAVDPRNTSKICHRCGVIGHRESF